MTTKEKQRGKPGNGTRREWEGNGGARCVTEHWIDGLFLFRLCTPPSQRHKGYARKLLKEVIDNTDRPIYLQPDPWGDEPVSTADLTRFYESLGFREFTSEQFKDLGYLIDTATPILRLTRASDGT